MMQMITDRERPIDRLSHIKMEIAGHLPFYIHRRPYLHHYRALTEIH